MGFRERLASVWYRAQNKFLLGPAVYRLNRDLLKMARRFRPHLVFVYRGTHVFPSTLAKLRQQGCVLMAYNNDDPFSPAYPLYVWRHFKAGLSQYHHIFAYRPKNLDDYRERGFSNVSLLRSLYLPEQTYPLSCKPVDGPYACDVIFIGHHEPDGRDDILKFLIENGVNLKLYGTLWENSPHYALFCRHMGGAIRSVYGTEYNKALNSARMGLVFLSHLNNDTYTRRCFEIPATQTVMLAPYNDDLASLFVSDEETVFYTSREELLERIRALLASPATLERVAKAGLARLKRDGHTARERALQVLGTLAALDLPFIPLCCGGARRPASGRPTCDPR